MAKQFSSSSPWSKTNLVLSKFVLYLLTVVWVQSFNSEAKRVHVYQGRPCHQFVYYQGTDQATKQRHCIPAACILIDNSIDGSPLHNQSKLLGLSNRSQQKLDVSPSTTTFNPGQCAPRAPTQLPKSIIFSAARTCPTRFYTAAITFSTLTNSDSNSTT